MNPLNGYIQIELVEESKQSASGILISEKSQTIRAVAVADSITDVKVGDHLEVKAGSTIQIGEWAFVNVKDVLAIRGKS